MTESKAKRLIVAFTVGAVVLIVTLLSVLIFQLISIGVKKNRERELDNAIMSYKQMIIDEENNLKAYSSKWFIEMRARELGYVYELDYELGD